MPAEDIAFAQEDFLRKGGLFVDALRRKYASGELIRAYEYAEYPKMISIPKGKETVKRSTETVDKKTIAWEETIDTFDIKIAYSEEDEERILQGGKPAGALEDERQELLGRCRVMGLKVDRGWSALRLRRELGDKLDAPEPVDKMGALEAELANLRKMAEMQVEIDRLRAQLTQPADESDAMRQQLADPGVASDKRRGSGRVPEVAAA